MPISYKNKIYTTLGTPTVVSGNGTFVTNSAGVPAKDYTVKGRTIVWNQLMDKSKYPSTTTTNGVTFTNNGDGTITANGTATANAIFAPIGLNNPTPIVSGHKFLFISCPSGGSLNTYYSDLKKVPEDETFYDVGVGVVMTTTSTTTGLRFNIRVISGHTANNLVFKPKLFDLTQMFGAGNEPATPAEFRAMFPDDYYPYNAGELKSIMPEAVETKNQSGETKRVNIPSSKYFPDGMRSAGSVYDEINFLSQKAIKRVGVRPYQAGDENNTGFITDKKNTVYALSTPVETAITPPLQALSTYKGFTSFSAPNSLTQNGPLSVTYYAEGGANPESGWLTSYKRKLYMGRTIEWNQLLDKSKYPVTTTTNGVTFTNNGDGTITANGTATANAIFAPIGLNNPTPIVSGHKFLFISCPSGGSLNTYYSDLKKVPEDETFFDVGEGLIMTTTSTTTGLRFNIRVYSGYTANNLVFKPQLFDLTQMFGAGNEPTTPEEFWSYFDHKLYPYNAGETQPLFKISRKSQWGSVTVASLYVGEDIIIPQIVRN